MPAMPSTSCPSDRQQIDVKLIKDLKPGISNENWPICAQVVEIFQPRNSQKNLCYFKVVLEDQSGKIDALAYDETNVKRFFEQLQQNQKYYFKNASVTEKQNVNQLTLNQSTVVTPFVESVKNTSGIEPTTDLSDSIVNDETYAGAEAIDKAGKKRKISPSPAPKARKPTAMHRYYEGEIKLQTIKKEKYEEETKLYKNINALITKMTS